MILITGITSCPEKTLGRPHCLSKQTNHSLGYIGRRVLREQRYCSSSPKSIRIQSSDVFVSRIIWPPTQEIHWIRSKRWTFENRQSGVTWYPGFFFHFEKDWRNHRYWEMKTKNRSLYPLYPFKLHFTSLAQQQSECPGHTSSSGRTPQSVQAQNWSYAAKTSWWLNQPIWKILVKIKMDHFPR